MAKREIPGLEALLRGYTPDQIEILQKALDRFDGSYMDLQAHLKSLGAERETFAAVNQAIKLVMGKSRGEVDTWDADEMNLWGEGYEISRERIDQLNFAAQEVRFVFEDLKSRRML